MAAAMLTAVPPPQNPCTYQEACAVTPEGHSWQEGGSTVSS